MMSKQSRWARRLLFFGGSFLISVACGDPGTGTFEDTILGSNRSADELAVPCAASSLLDFDSDNCGACGLVCGAGQVCKAGICVAKTTNIVASGELTMGLLQLGTWAERGPELGGRIDGLVVDPVADPVWLIGSPGGGIWRKNDSQSVWAKPANYALADFSIVHLERDLVSTTKYYGVAWSTLYSTTDLGNNWTLLVNPGANPGPLHPLQTEVVDPKPFAQLSFSASTRAVLFGKPCSGLYYSFDGVNFTQHFPFSGGSTNEDNCLGNIAPDPISKRVYFSTLKAVGFEAAHVYRSTCAWANNSPCLTWEPANVNLPQNVNVSAMTHANRTAANHFIALVNPSGNTQTWETTNGTSWSLKSTLSAQWTPRPLSFTGTPGEIFQGNVRAFHSANLGTSWTAFTLPGTQEHVDVRAIFFSKTLNKVYTATDGTYNTGAQANFTKWSWTTGSVPTSGAAVGHSGLKVWRVGIHAGAGEAVYLT